MNWKTAFNNNNNACRLTRVPAVFQDLVNDVLRDLLNNSVFIYVDNILIFSKDLASHI